MKTTYTVVTTGRAIVTSTDAIEEAAPIADDHAAECLMLLPVNNWYSPTVARIPTPSRRTSEQTATAACCTSDRLVDGPFPNLGVSKRRVLTLNGRRNPSNQVVADLHTSTSVPRTGEFANAANL